MIGIKFNGIDIYCFNVDFLFLISFFLHIMDSAVYETPTHFFGMVHFIMSFTFFLYARYNLS